MPKRTQMKFSPNTGYAFAVAEDTWHSADTVGAGGDDAGLDPAHLFRRPGLLRFLRNRAKRVGNFLGNEVRSPDAALAHPADRESR